MPEGYLVHECSLRSLSRCSSVVECRLGKTDVESPILSNGSTKAKIVQWQNTAFVKQERESDSRFWLQIFIFFTT